VCVNMDVFVSGLGCGQGCAGCDARVCIHECVRATRITLRPILKIWLVAQSRTHVCRTPYE